MKVLNKPKVIEMTQLDQEIISPKEFLGLTDEHRRDILRVTPCVNRIGTTDLNDTNFVSLVVKWKTPKYRVSL